MTLEKNLRVIENYFVRRNLEDLLKPTDTDFIPPAPVAAVPIFY